MQSILQELYVHGMLYLVMIFLTFVNIIVPVSGSSTQTPLLAIITGDAHYAITVSTWLLMISCAIISFVFRKDRRYDYVWRMLPATILFAVLGALFLVQLPDLLVSLLLLVAATHFLIKTLRHLEKKEEKKALSIHVLSIVGAASSFLQGMGLPGGAIRAGYLYAEGLSIEEVRGTAEFLTFASFAAANIVRFHENQLSVPDMIHWTIIFAPLLLLATYLGRHLLIRLPDRVKDGIILVTMILVVVGLIIRIAHLAL